MGFQVPNELNFFVRNLLILYRILTQKTGRTMMHIQEKQQNSNSEK